MSAHSSDLDVLEMPERFLEYAFAYLDSARVLCDQLIKNPSEVTYARGNACNFNARLAVELFLKASILKKDPNMDLHHVIEHLRDVYARQYVEPRFHWDVQFTTRVIGGEAAANERIVKEHLKKNPPDQRLRYPMNKRREPWEESGTFDASNFMLVIQAIERDMVRLKQEIFK